MGSGLVYYHIEPKGPFPGTRGGRAFLFWSVYLWALVMLIRMGEDARPEETNNVRAIGAGSGRVVHEVDGGFVVLSDTDATDLGLIQLPGVESVSSFNTPYKLVQRSVRPNGTRVRVGEVENGGDSFVVAAGSCAVESEAQLDRTTEAAASSGANILRGGAFKPRTSPYKFQGLKYKGLEMLSRVGRRHGLSVVTEVLTAEDVKVVVEHADILQIGARNMQNFALLESAGRSGMPVVLKRGLSATIEEFLLAAVYIALQGNLNIILCERGIRTFVTATRNTLDLGGVVLLQQLTHLPVVVDPSHVTGRRGLVRPLSMAAAAAGTSGLLIEIHPDPDCALCDGPQSISTADFPELMARVSRVLTAGGHSLHPPCSSLGTRARLDLESSRLRDIDAALIRMIDERVTTGLRIGELQSKISRPRTSSDADEAWGRKVLEIHAEA